MVLQVRETSRRGWGRGKGTAQGSKSLEAVKRDFSDVVLPRSLHDNVRALAAVTANTRQHGAPFRHMMFYGGLLCRRWCSFLTPCCTVALAHLLQVGRSHVT